MGQIIEEIVQNGKSLGKLNIPGEFKYSYNSGTSTFAWKN